MGKATVMIGLVWSAMMAAPSLFALAMHSVLKARPSPLPRNAGSTNQHADNGPALIEERGFPAVWPEIRNGSRELLLKFGNNDFSGGAER
jgi:hypothetical protein